MLIGALVKQTNLSRDTIRFYEKMNLIQSITRNNGYKDYPAHSIQQLQLILQAKSLGFSLAEIKQLSDLVAQADIPAEQMQLIFQTKLSTIDEKINQLEQMRSMLTHLMLGAPCPLKQQCVKGV